MRSMLLKRGDGNQHHVCALQEVPHFWRSHVRQIVFHFLFVPERVGLCRALACNKHREEQTGNESFTHNILQISFETDDRYLALDRYRGIHLPTSCEYFSYSTPNCRRNAGSS